MKKNTSIAARLAVLVFAGLCVASFAVKSVRLSDPYFGSHIFRQLQTMSTIDAYIHEGIDLRHPKVNWNGYPGYIVAEFPVFQAVAAYMSRVTGQAPLETTRILNLILGGLTAIAVYLMAVFWCGRTAALYSVTFFLFSPLNIMFHQSTLVDIASVAMMMAAFVIFLRRWESSSMTGAVLFWLASTAGVLIKPLYFFPVILLLLVRGWKEFYSGSSRNLMKTAAKFQNILISLAVTTAVLLGWMLSGPSGDSMLNYMVWEVLFTPRFYVNIFTRLCTQFLNPLTVLLFLIGIVLLWKDRRNETKVLWLLPVVYYLVFPHLNLPHAYYSLILIPFLSVIAGHGAAWLEDALSQQGMTGREYFRTAVWICAAFVSVISYVNNLSAAMILPNQRYAEIEREVRPQLEPMQYAVLFINRNAEFRHEEYLRNRPSVYLKSFFKELSLEELQLKQKDYPLIRPAMMYAIGQNGEMNYIESPGEVRLPELKEQYQGHLRYVLFYLFDDKREVMRMMKPSSPVYQSDAWIIYDVKND